MAAISLSTSVSNEESVSWAERFGEGMRDFTLYSAPGVIGSAAYSFLNTGVAIGNMFGADWEERDLAEDFRKLDENGGYWEDTANYYEDKQSVLDIGGLVLGSVLPGTAAVKILRGVQRGSRLKKGLDVSKAKPWYRASPLESKNLNKITESIRKGTRANELAGKEKLQLLAGGFKQQAMEAGVYEMATLATMASNSSWKNEDLNYLETIGANLRSVAFGTALGGGIGGGLQWLSETGKVKSLLRENAQRGINPFSAIEENLIRDADGVLTPGAVAGDGIANTITGIFGTGNKSGSIYDLLTGEIKKIDGFDINLTQSTELRNAANTTYKEGVTRILRDLKLVADDEGVRKQLFNSLMPVNPDAKSAPTGIPENFGDINFGANGGVENLQRNADTFWGLEKADTVAFSPAERVHNIKSGIDSRDIIENINAKWLPKELRDAAMKYTGDPATLPELTDDMVTALQRNARGVLTQRLSNAEEFKTAAYTAESARDFHSGFKFLLATAEPEMVKDVIKKKAFAPGQTRGLIDELQENMVLQNPELRLFKDVMDGIDGTAMSAERVMAKHGLDEVGLGKAMEVAEGELMDVAKLRDAMNIFARKNKPKFNAVTGEFFDSKFKNISGLINDPVYFNGAMRSRSVMNMKTGEVLKDGFNPTVMDMPLAQRAKLTAKDYDPKNPNTPFNQSLRYLIAQRTLLDDKNVVEKMRQGLGSTITADKLTIVDSLLINAKKQARVGAKKGQEIFQKDKPLNLTVKLPNAKAKTFTIKDLDELVQFNQAVKKTFIRDEVMKNQTRTGADRLTVDEIAIKHNVSPRAVVEINTPGAKTQLEDGTGYYTRMDSDEIYHVQLEHTKQGVKGDGEIQGIAAAERRNTANQEFMNSVIADVLGEDLDALLLKNFIESGENFARLNAPVDKGAGLVKSAQGELGEISLYSTQIGKNTATLEGKVKKKISDALSTAAVPVIDDPKSLAEFSVLNQKLRQGEYARVGDLRPEVYDWLQANVEDFIPGQTLVRREVIDASDNIAKAADNQADDAVQTAIAKLDELETGDVAIQIQSPKVSNFIDEYHKLNRDEVINKIKKLDYATGQSNNWDPRIIYPGKFDSKRFNHFYILEDPTEKLASAGVKNQGFITAPNAELLQQKLNALQGSRAKDGLPALTVRSSSSIENFRKAIDDYDSKLVIKDSFVDSSMQSNKALFDYMPEPSKETVNEFINGLLSNSSNVVKRAVKLKYSKEVNTLQQYDAIAKDSVFGGKGQRSAAAKQINTMLNISNKDEFKNLMTAQEAFDDAVSNAFYKIRGAFEKANSFTKTKQGRLANLTKSQQQEMEAWQHMDEMLESHGFPRPFTDAEDIILANTNAPKRVVEGLVAKANGLLATAMLRWDSAQAIVNAFSTPIMLMPEMQTLRKQISDPKIARSLGSKSAVNLDNLKMPNNLKIMQQAVQDMRKPGLLENYKARGITTSLLQELRDAAGDIGYRGKESIGTWRARLSKVSDVLSYATDKSEELTKFVAARSAEIQLDEFAKAGLRIDDATREAIVKSMVTKVHGNYTASQRPAMFQGAIGQAVGLFQTYQFNLIQRAATHWQTGNKGSVARMLTAQASIFGAQSVPGFQVMNDHIAGRTAGEKDMYSETLSELGEVGEVLLYGFGSNLTAPVFGAGIDFFTRGDLTPRTPIIIPTGLDEVPIVNFTRRFFGNAINTVKQITGGADISESVGQALAHNGLNRPIQGAAQIFLTNDRTTNRGTTLARYPNPFEPDQMTAINWVNAAAKLMGTQTTDEQIAVNSMYRALEYRANRYDKLNGLGKVVRTNIRAAEDGDDGAMSRQAMQGVLSKYVGSGGNIETFQRWMGNNYVNASESQLRQLSAGSTNESRYLYSILENNPGEYF